MRSSHVCFPIRPALLDDPRIESQLLRLHSCTELQRFWEATRALLNRLIPSDALLLYVGFEDFAKTWGASSVFATPSAVKPAGWMSQRRAVDVMPPYILTRPNVPVCRLSDAMPNSRQLRRTEFFRRYMEPEGWHHIACSLFWESGGVRSEIAIRRTGEEGDFTDTEMNLLQRLHPHFKTVLNRLSYDGRCPTPSNEGGANHLLPPTDRLTPAERQLLRFIQQGHSDKEIAIELGKSFRTVKTQLAAIYRKLHVSGRNRLQALLR